MVRVVWLICTTVPLVSIYKTTRHIQKEDSNPGADYVLGFGNKFDGCHPVFFNTNKQAFQFFSLTQLYIYYCLATLGYCIKLLKTVTLNIHFV